MKKAIAWGWLYRGRTLEPVAFRKRAQMMDYAVQRCIGAGDYDRLGTDSKRWKLARRYGHRIVRVTVEAS